ncbi:hypothetical protein J2S70_000120 [Trueperella bonasi]|uniref:Uncharacterized protein n=1 Tax=Trueperella bonasi TaxID=312286 RepID=A0ABT9NDS1_9ACTO|nr:hypothetical protein [Trueperella bonasi]MDP9805538.1 hypothetical protein [Trueperella bonasi]
MVHVPRIEVQASQVISAAIDGFDIVIVGNVRLDARERRVLHRRAISKGALILAMNWPNATFTVDCELLALSGLNGGAGHIKSVDYLVSSQHGQSYIRYHGSRTARALEPLHDAHGNVGRSVTPYLNAVPDRIPS